VNQIKHLWDGLSRGYRAAVEMEVVDLASRLTLLALLFNPVDDQTVRPFGLSLAGIGLVFSPAARRPALWFFLTLVTGWRVVADWPLADNHAYLLCYWCFALFCSLIVRDVRASLAMNGRLLIGLVFTFATLWKAVLSPDYLNGTFFRMFLLIDERFADLSRLVGGLSAEQLEANRRLVEDRFHNVFGPENLTLIVPAALTTFAQIATWWTVTIEAAVALCFLWPRKDGIYRQRHVPLLLFCATTFAVAPVAGFGWLLLLMGIAQCEPERTTVRALYLAIFFLILFYQEFSWTLVLG